MKVTPPSGVSIVRLSRGYGASYEISPYGETPVVVHAAPADDELEALIKLSCELELIGHRLLNRSEECRACAQALDLDAKEQQAKTNPTPEIEEKQVLARWLNDSVSVVYSDGLFTAWYETGTQPWGEISMCGKPSEDLETALKGLEHELKPILYELEVSAGRVGGINRISPKEVNAFSELVKASKSTEAQE